MTTRRRFLSAALVGLPMKAERAVTGSFVNDGFPLGHKLRDRSFAVAPKRQIKIPIIIVGAGIAGLSAAWRLDKRGYRDFLLLEMEREPGGNARSGANEISEYPWAAHYIPVPAKETELVRELMDEFGVLEGDEWNERYLCYSPQERLFLHGRWHEDLQALDGAPAKDQEQWNAFYRRMREFGATKQFTVPMEVGARPSPLDHLSMNDWMRQEGFNAPSLRWYADYACRDEYGGAMEDISAWAGVYYFAARSEGADKDKDKGPITQPDGNGWIVKRLAAKLKRNIVLDTPVVNIRRDGPRLRVTTSSIEYICDSVIFAAPLMLAKFLLEKPPAASMQYSPQYSPWITANLTLDRMPKERGLELAWDNVIFNSPSLGYVVATHMSLRSRNERSVWTWYAALSAGSPRQNRIHLLQKPWRYWRDYILNDLELAHPDIRQCVSRIDIMRIGHGMARPVPRSIFSPGRMAVAKARGPVFFAHSDVSGFSVFEEAQYRGVKAADSALRWIGSASRL